MHIKTFLLTFIIIVMIMLLVPIRSTTNDDSWVTEFRNEHVTASAIVEDTSESIYNVYTMVLSSDTKRDAKVIITCTSDVTIIRSKTNYRAGDSVQTIDRCVPGATTIVNMNSGFLRFAAEGTADLFYPLAK